MNWNIYHSNGQKIAVAHTLTYSGEWMGDEFVITTIKSPEPIDFAIGDYLEYRGERYYLNVDPTVQKGARVYSRGDAFVYDSIKFYSVSDELTRCKFLDVVLAQDTTHYTGLTDFTFHAYSVIDLADRIKANLDRLYRSGMEWTVRVVQGDSVYTSGGSVPSDHDAVGGTKNKVVSINNISAWEALCLSSSEFDLSFIVRNREIIIGRQGTLLSKYLQYGLGNGLVKIERTTDESQQVVTRLRAYGNTKNLPTRYYANLGKTCYIDLNDVSVGRSTDGTTEKGLVLEFSQEVNKRLSFISTTTVEGLPQVSHVFEMKLGNKTALGGYQNNGDRGDSHIFIWPEIEGNTMDRINAFVAEYDAGHRKAYPLTNYDKDKWGNEWITKDPNNLHPAQLSSLRLMLPGFPYNTLDPYIDSPRIDILGVREATVYFDGSNNLDDIYPSIEWGGNNTVVTGSTIEDKGIFDDGKDIPSFKITIADIGFNIDDYRNGDTPKLSMKDGMCGGREFEIVKSEKVDNGYELTLNRTEDSGLELWFPYDAYNIKSGDKFVVLGINMPDIYVENASNRLLEKAKEWLAENDTVKYKYSLNVDPIFLQRQHDTHIAANEASIHNTIKAGDVVSFGDFDLAINESVTIDKLEIKEGEQQIPQYTITLTDKKSASTIQRIQQKVDKLASGEITGGIDPGNLEDMVKNAGAKHFLSKTRDDRAKGNITFEKNVTVGGAITSAMYTEGPLGSGYKMGKYGNTDDSYLEIDRILVRKIATFVELVVQKMRHVGGSLVLSPASMTCSKVSFLNASGKEVEKDKAVKYRCYFEVEDGQKKIDNEFIVGDLARYQTMNLESGNKYYWRKVIAVGKDYIDLSVEDCDEGSMIPAAGDSIVQMGNANDGDDDRKNIILISAYGDASPSIQKFVGVNSYSLEGKEMTFDGFDSRTGRALFRVFGDFYFGNREESNFVKYSQDKGLEILANSILVKTTEGNLTINLAEAFDKIQQDIEGIAAQADRSYELWYYNHEPTNDNLPASEWTTDELKALHEGDQFYWREKGLAYRYENGEWVEITDKDTKRALEIAGEKKRVFVTVPMPPYEKGDLWTNARWRETITIEGETQEIVLEGELMQCVNARVSGDFSITDWEIATEYTTKEKVNALIELKQDEFKAYVQSAKEDLNQRYAGFTASIANDMVSVTMEVSEAKNDLSEAYARFTASIQDDISSISATASWASSRADDAAGAASRAEAQAGFAASAASDGAMAEINAKYDDFVASITVKATADGSFIQAVADGIDFEGKTISFTGDQIRMIASNVSLFEKNEGPYKDFVYIENGGMHFYYADKMSGPEKFYDCALDIFPASIHMYRSNGKDITIGEGDISITGTLESTKINVSSGEYSYINLLETNILKSYYFSTNVVTIGKTSLTEDNLKSLLNLLN